MSIAVAVTRSIMVSLYYRDTDLHLVPLDTQ